MERAYEQGEISASFSASWAPESSIFQRYYLRYHPFCQKQRAVVIRICMLVGVVRIRHGGLLEVILSRLFAW